MELSIFEVVFDDNGSQASSQDALETGLLIYARPNDVSSSGSGD